MGARIDFTNHIHIAAESFENGVLKYVGYRDVTQELLEEIARDARLKYVQISGELPEAAYRTIDDILARRPDLYFRIFNIYGDRTFDLSVLGRMPHLSRVRIDAHLRDNKEAIDLAYLCELPDLKGLHLDLFDWRDYSFIKRLSPALEELTLFADTVSGGVQFDCQWLLPYGKLRSLFLGKKAKKHLECIGQLSSLKALSLRGIRPTGFGFLKELSLESFALLWCGGTDLSALGELKSLRELELWRIMKLESLDFICSLDDLEVLRLQDLKHVRTLPDLKRLTKLRKIEIDNVPIDPDTLDQAVRKLIWPQSAAV